MTQQSSDWVFYNERRYELLGDSRGMLPRLDELGIQPKLYGTATRRCYEAEYEIDEEQLYLTMIKVGSDQLIDQFPPIGDIYPAKELFAYSYQEERLIPTYDLVYRLKHPMRINGTITIKFVGKDDRNGKQTRWGIPSLAEILKLKMDKGHVEAIKNVIGAHDLLRSAIDAVWQDQYSKLRQMPFEEWTKYRFNDYQEAQKRYQEFLLEEF